MYADFKHIRQPIIVTARCYLESSHILAASLVVSFTVSHPRCLSHHCLVHCLIPSQPQSLCAPFVECSPGCRCTVAAYLNRVLEQHCDALLQLSQICRLDAVGFAVCSLQLNQSVCSGDIRLQVTTQSGQATATSHSSNHTAATTHL